MRREELMSTKEEDFSQLVNTEVGHLGIIDSNGYPRIIPINFVYNDGKIYFHGANEGEKYEILKNNPKVTFSIDIPYSFIPSHFTAKNYGCSATHFFKSILFRGKGSIITDMDEKREAFQRLMEKYQPEGKFTSFITDNKIYNKILETTAVFGIYTESYTIKSKFGQNESINIRNKIIESLKNRGTEIDIKTIEEMRKFM